ncbi:MAG: hypothetical protein HGA42_11360, partial [Nostocales cyanobacterium W4_Combined_metabat2_030]|nr:hypothetical protein [Nostocales cyanobacterium W4_Combined_metabat2_030]
MYFYQNKYQEFIDALNKIPNFDPENSKVFTWRIAALKKLRKFLDAEILAQDALAKMPNNIDILNQIGLLYFDWTKYDTTIEIVDRITKLDDQN